MLIVKVKKDLESALKFFKNKVNNVKLIQKIRERQEYVKPSAKRRENLNKAKFKQNKKDLD